MARQPQTTINVNSQQFQQFARQFNVFSGQIKQLNTQFAQINTQIQRTNVLLRGVNATLNTGITGARTLFTWASRITKQFISWSTIIGGVTALLGMGGGLYGIERLAASIMAKRRMVMGLGADYGKTQANMIFSQGLIGSPQGVLQNIALGQHGSQEQMTTLLGMGIPFGSKMDPNDIMDKIVEKLPDILNRAGPGKELMMAQAYHLDKIFTDPFDMLRLATEEGRKEYQEKRALVKEYEHLLKVSPKATKAWTELELQLQAARAQIETVFGEILAPLAGPLKRLSEAFAHLVRVFLETPAVQKFITFLSKEIDKLATKMSKLEKEDIQKFIDEITGWLPTMEDFKSAMHDFVDILKTAVNVLRFLSPSGGNQHSGTTPGTYGAPPPGPAGQAGTRRLIDDIKRIHKHGIGGGAAPPTAAPPGGGGGGGGEGGFGAGATRYPHGGIGGFGMGGDFGQAPGLPSWASSVLPGLGGLGPSGGWPGAVRSMAPSSGRSRSLIDQYNNLPGGGGQQQGALSTGNWQMNRVANLVVRNVPGANIFMSAAGMTG
jgi:hypothetical protein